MEIKISEAGKDVLFQILEEWHDEHLPALQASQLNERMLDCEDELIPQIYELIKTEIRLALESEI